MDKRNDGTVKLVSRDGQVFEVPMAVACMSELIKDTFDENDESDNDGDDDSENDIRDFPLPNVSSPILEKVLEYCQHYQMSEPMTPIQTPLKSNKLEDLVQPWYAEYVRNDKVSKDTLFDLVAAANYMDIKALLDLTCLAVSILIKGKSADELRAMFNISDEQLELANTATTSNSSAPEEVAEAS